VLSGLPFLAWRMPISAIMLIERKRLARDDLPDFVLPDIQVNPVFILAFPRVLLLINDKVLISF